MFSLGPSLTAGSHVLKCFNFTPPQAEASHSCLMTPTYSSSNLESITILAA